MPLKWHLPVGLLYDLFSGAGPSGPDILESAGKAKPGASPLPWRLVLHFSDWPSDRVIPLDPDFKTLHDTFMSGVKEADFLRNGTGKAIKSLSKPDSTGLWHAVQRQDFHSVHAVYIKLMRSVDGSQIRHVPIKVYLPSTSGATDRTENGQGTVRTVQGLIPALGSSREPQTIGAALHGLLPTVFPSRRSYIHARATLHGAIVPPSAQILEILQNAAFSDGFLHVVVMMVNHNIT